MNSSIFISDRPWRRLLCHYAAWLLLFGILFGGAVLALDPYDTGRFAVFAPVGVPQFGQRLAAASLGRAQQFDAAIVGNSTIQLVDPSHINAKNIHAVSLAIPGTGPREQLAVTQWFIDHHEESKTRVIIIGLDDRWCAANRSLDLTHPFPFWLYSAHTAEYLVNMMQFQSLESAMRKIKLMRGKIPALRADGYNDYDAGRVWDHAGFLSRLDAPTEEGEVTPAATAPYDFPAAPLLKEFLGKLPPNVSIVLVVPPRYRQDMKSDAGQQRKACAKIFVAIAASRPHTAFIDFLSRRDLVNEDEDYWDRLHFRVRVARAVEDKINTVLENIE